MSAQQALADAEVTGTSGGGLVKATVNGQGELMDLIIGAGAVDTDDPEETARTIADLVLAAVRDAYRSAEDLQQQQMGPFAAAMQGGGMPGMPGMPGGGGGLNLPGGLDLSSLGIGAPAHEDPAHEDPADEDKPAT
jgi:nucleoid-associated protein EbfC